jgi:hypothetical protein
LRDNDQAMDRVGFQLERQPSVVDVAGKVAGLDAGMPETGNEEQG